MEFAASAKALSHPRVTTAAAVLHWPQRVLQQCGPLGLCSSIGLYPVELGPDWRLQAPISHAATLYQQSTTTIIVEPIEPTLTRTRAHHSTAIISAENDRTTACLHRRQRRDIESVPRSRPQLLPARSRCDGETATSSNLVIAALPRIPNPSITPSHRRSRSFSRISPVAAARELRGSSAHASRSNPASRASARCSATLRRIACYYCLSSTETETRVLVALKCPLW